MKLSGVYAQVYARLADDHSLFPALPDSAVKLREALQKPNCDVATFARLIKVDAPLAGFIMNSARGLRYLTRVPPEDLESAVRRIGLRDTYNFAVTYFARSAFRSDSPRLRKLLTGVYRNATRTSVISHHLASQISGFSSGRAMLGGLLQDIGVAPVLVCLGDTRGLPEDPAALTRAVDTLCPLVSALVLESWGFGEDLLAVARSRKQWFRDEQEKADLADIVLIARLHAAIGTPEFRACPPVIDLPAFAKLPLGDLTPNNSLQLIEDSREELDELERMLTG